MKARRRGSIFFTGGSFAYEPAAEYSSLSLGKAALRNLTYSLAQELGAHDIHVATVTVYGFVQRARTSIRAALRSRICSCTSSRRDILTWSASINDSRRSGFSRDPIKNRNKAKIAAEAASTDPPVK